VGRYCVGGWEEVHDTCETQYAFACNATHGSSDALCECGEPIPSPPPAPPLSPGACLESTWPDVKDGRVCGACKVLVENLGDYETCDGYCENVGRYCVGAWDDDGGSCTETYAFACNATGPSIDALCECGELIPSPPLLPAPSPSSPPPPPPFFPVYDGGTGISLEDPIQKLIKLAATASLAKRVAAAIGRTPPSPPPWSHPK